MSNERPLVQQVPRTATDDVRSSVRVCQSRLDWLEGDSLEDEPEQYQYLARLDHHEREAVDDRYAGVERDREHYSRRAQHEPAHAADDKEEADDFRRESGLDDENPEGQEPESPECLIDQQQQVPDSKRAQGERVEL